jgi:hypothetical protein
MVAVAVESLSELVATSTSLRSRQCPRGHPEHRWWIATFLAALIWEGFCELPEALQELKISSLADQRLNATEQRRTASAEQWVSAVPLAPVAQGQIVVPPRWGESVAKVAPEVPRTDIRHSAGNAE